MENPKKIGNGFIKKVFIYVILAIEMFLLYKVSIGFVSSQKYFSLSKDFAIPFVLILILSLWTISLISQTIQKGWESYLSTSIIFIFLITLLSQFKIKEALIGSILLSVFYFFQLKRTLSLSKGLVKVKVRFSGKPVTKGFLFIVTAGISIAVFLLSEKKPSIDVGKWAADLAGKPIEDAIRKEYEKEIPEDIKSINLESLRKSNPQVFTVLDSFGINEIPAHIPTSENVSKNLSGTIEKSISDQVNKVVEPYRRFFNPAIALLVFGILQIYNSVIYFIFSNTVNLIFVLLKKFKVVTTEKILTEKEILII